MRYSTWVPYIDNAEVLCCFLQLINSAFHLTSQVVIKCELTYCLTQLYRNSLILFLKAENFAHSFPQTHIFFIVAFFLLWLMFLNLTLSLEYLSGCRMASVLAYLEWMAQVKQRPSTCWQATYNQPLVMPVYMARASYLTFDRRSKTLVIVHSLMRLMHYLQVIYYSYFILLNAYFLVFYKYSILLIKYQ